MPQMLKEKLNQLLNLLTKPNKKERADLSALHKEEEGFVMRRRISPWARRKHHGRRTNHPWVR